MPIAAPPTSTVTLYAEQVLSGELVAGRLVRLACERHLRDLEHGHERGLYFDADAAQDAIDFFELLQLAEGAHAGQPFRLTPWEQFTVGSLFGWMGTDGYRRFRKAYVEVAKGNGKTPVAAGIGLYGLIADGERGAEVYAAAVTKDQAGIAFKDAKTMVEKSPALARRIDVNVGNLAVLKTNSFFRPVSAEARSLDGKRVHMAIIDELHEHPSDLVVNKMTAGTKGRLQPLILEITNSGWNRHSVCWQHHEYSEKVLLGVLQDDSWFAYVAGLDVCEACRRSGKTTPQVNCEDCDDWQDPAVWSKANPNLGVSVTSKYLEDQVRTAQGIPAQQAIVQRLNFCIWTEGVTKWIDLDTWDAGGEPFDLDELRGRECWAGLDLSSNTDLTAAIWLFPPDDSCKVWRLRARFWIPDANVMARVQRDQVPYDVWIREGHIETTTGNVVDKDYVQAAVLEESALYRTRELAYDRMFADQLTQHLADEGMTVVPFGQGFFSMAAPCKELERILLGKLLQHGGHPVLRWNASNVAVRQDPAGNKKPDKDSSTERIDGVAALLMALGRAAVTAAPQGPAVFFFGADDLTDEDSET